MLEFAVQSFLYVSDGISSIFREGLVFIKFFHPSLILGTKRGSHLVDTLVMANLGYWQMKVSPGVWYLQLAPGRSADLYALKDSGDGSPGNRSTKLITINDLRGRLVHLEVAKKRGKEHEELLNASDDQLLEKRKVCGLNT
ncbi:hypothetical protein B296_00059171 [Ensete ventricosum]|uniref:Uncharacterized protein n=1 Tax=Ensete ventricosum TaxID=4639 RepID=A0A426WZE3_ENSVE|nr:hypothetical protein B296_00059171 [Ensete ventricosum]